MHNIIVHKIQMFSFLSFVISEISKALENFPRNFTTEFLCSLIIFVRWTRSPPTNRKILLRWQRSPTMCEASNRWMIELFDAHSRTLHGVAQPLRTIRKLLENRIVNILGYGSGGASVTVNFLQIKYTEGK